MDTYCNARPDIENTLSLYETHTVSVSFIMPVKKSSKTILQIIVTWVIYMRSSCKLPLCNLFCPVMVKTETERNSVFLLLKG